MGSFKYLRIQLCSMDYKLMLYADNALFYISKPKTTIPLIQKSGSVSVWLQINWEQSKRLEISWLSHSGALSQQMHIDAIKCLSRKVPRNTNKLMQINLDPIVSQIVSDTNRWHLLFQSLWRRVNIIRMNILPWLLYILNGLSAYWKV